jgi:hypothetical protein
MKSSRKLVMNAVLVQKADTELRELLDTIEYMRVVLYRFVPILDSESLETVTLTQATLKTISLEISRIFAVQRTQNSRDRLENWDNEGGSIEYNSG